MKNLLVICIIFHFIGYSQDYSSEDYIYLKRHENIKIELSKQDFKITKNIGASRVFKFKKTIFC